MKNLTRDDLIKIHEEIIRIGGEEMEVLSNIRLNEVVSKHKKSKTLAGKAAVLLHDIPYFQPFIEGNKRTAFSSFKVFLDLNSKKVKVGNRELEVIILRSVNNNNSLRDVEKWLKKKLI